MVTLTEVLAALEQAAEYRRKLGLRHGDESAFALKSLITGEMLVNQKIGINKAGWAHIGYVLDPYAAPQRPRVLWNPDTGGVKVERM